MRRIPNSYETWPRTKGGDPIFTCSEDSIFYAHLITDSVSEIANLVKLRQKVFSHLKIMRSRNNPSMQKMMDLAVKGQFYRECLEELERIEKEGNS